MIKFRWAKRLMQDAEKIEKWLTGDSMSDPKPLPVKYYPDNTNERIEQLEEKIAEVSEDNKRLKKMLLKCSVDMANLETIIKAAVICQSQIISDIQSLYTFLKRIEGETSSRLDTGWDTDEEDNKEDNEEDDGEGSGSGGLLN